MPPTRRRNARYGDSNYNSQLESSVDCPSSIFSALHETFDQANRRIRSTVEQVQSEMMSMQSNLDFQMQQMRQINSDIFNSLDFPSAHSNSNRNSSTRLTSSNVRSRANQGSSSRVLSNATARTNRHSTLSERTSSLSANETSRSSSRYNQSSRTETEMSTSSRLSSNATARTTRSSPSRNSSSRSNSSNTQVRVGGPSVAQLPFYEPVVQAGVVLCPLIIPLPNFSSSNNDLSNQSQPIYHHPTISSQHFSNTQARGGVQNNYSNSSTNGNNGTQQHLASQNNISSARLPIRIRSNSEAGVEVLDYISNGSGWNYTTNNTATNNTNRSGGRALNPSAALRATYFNGKQQSPASKKTKVLKKNSVSADNSEDDLCSICLCDFNNRKHVRTLQCGHKFHLICVNKWLSKNSNCPYCRQPACGITLVH